MAIQATKDNWWDFIPGASALVRLIGTTVELNLRGLALARAFVRDGWTAENFLELIDLHRTAMARYNDVVKVMTYSMLLAAAIATGQIEKSITSGKLKTLLNTRLGLALVEAYGWVNQIKGKIEKEAERIKGQLDLKAIVTTYQHLRIAHNIGLQFSPRYRDAVEDFYRNTADLSRLVFGPANILFHGLALLQLVINDTARINGRTAADGQAEYLTSATNAAQRVAGRSSAYAKDGSKFWADFQLIYIQPQLNSQYAAQIQRTDLIGRIDTAATTAKESAQSVTKSFTAYTEHLDPFLSDDNIKEMEAIQRDFNRDIRRPVERFQGFMATTFPNIIEVTEQLAKDDKVLAGGVLESLERTDYPYSLTEPQQASQGLRFNSIMDSAFVRGDGAPRSIERDMVIVRSIYDILEAR